MSKMSVVVASLFFGCVGLAAACAAPIQEAAPTDTGTTTSNLQVVGETSRCAGQPVASIGCGGQARGYVRCLTNRTTGKSTWEVQCPSVCPVEGGGGGPSTDPGTPGSPPSQGTGGGSGPSTNPGTPSTNPGTPSTNPGTPTPTPPPPAPPGYPNGTIGHEDPADSKVGPAAGSGSDTKGPPPGTDPGAPPCVPPSPTPVPPPPSNPSACAGLPVPEIGCRSGVPTPVCNADGGGRYHWSIACIEHPATPAKR
jgi:hypothetical protein